MKIGKSLRIVSVLLASTMLTGCASVSRELGKLTANKYATPRSGSVWVVPPPQLEPLAAEDKIAYVSFRNISDADIDFLNLMRNAATAQGWKLTNNPQEATCRLRASVRFFGEVDPESGGRNVANAMGLIAGAATGIGTAVAVNEITDNLGASGLAGLGIGALAGIGVANASKPREWALIVDVVLEEKSDQPITFNLTKDDAASANDRAGVSNDRMRSGGRTSAGNTTSATATRTSNYFPHGIRLSVWANQMSMTEEEAMPEIIRRAERVLKQMLPM